MLTTASEEPLTFWKNIALVVTFLILTPLTLGLSVFSLLSLQETSAEAKRDLSYAKTGVQLYASIPSEFPTISASVESSDARPQILKNYMESYNAPLSKYAEVLVQISDKYGLEYRLLTAIAQQESNLCKKIPPGSHNCWGWGIHSESNLGFRTYEEAIETVGAGLKENYIDKGYTTIEEIMSKYTPHSPNGAWAKGVSSFIAEME